MARFYCLFMSMIVAVTVTCPAVAQITVQGNLAHDLPAEPGEVITGTVDVRNDTGTEQRARAYLRDYMFYADGTNSYGEPGQRPRSNASWVQFAPETVTIPPQSTATISYEITVPGSLDSLRGPGSYWSMLMIEAVPPESDGTGDADVGFRQVTRYGVQLATHVGQAPAEVSFDGVSLTRDDEEMPVFQVDVVNTGSRMIRPDVYMRLFNAEGEEFGPFQGVRYRIYPGTSVRQRIPLRDLPPGDYQALFVVDAGDDAVFGGQYELTL